MIQNGTYKLKHNHFVEPLLNNAPYQQFSVRKHPYSTKMHIGHFVASSKRVVHTVVLQ